MLTGRDITVLGAGIGGLATAAALAARGARVQVVEQAPALREVGAGLQISPNGVAVLDALGLADAARATAPAARAVWLKDGPSGRQVARIPLTGPRPYLMFHRADLVGLLHARATDLGVTFRFGQRVTGVGPGPTIAIDGAAPAQAGFLVGADGLHSVLRPHLNGPAQPFFTGQVAYRAVIAGDTAPDPTVFMGPGRHLVRYPLGGGRVNLVGIEERSQWALESWSAPGDPDAMRAAFAGFGAEARASLDKVTTVNLWGLFRHPLAARWTGPGVALVGDAAHPTLPFMAQGANMALEDAWVLADCLAGAGPDRLERYQSLRQPRVARAIAAANANARNYHLTTPLLRPAAHLALRALTGAAPSLLTRQFDWLYHHDVTRPGSGA